MKRFLFAVIPSLILIANLFSGCNKQVSEAGELRIFNWGEYISDGTDGSMDVIEEFEKETGITVTAYDTYDSNEQMYAKLKSGSADYDIIFPSDYMISRLIEEDMIQPFQTDQLQNYSQVMPEYTGSVRGYDPTDQYSVPYTWGTVGIIYNRSMVEEITGIPAQEAITGWDAFWNPLFADNMFMFINSRDSFGIAEKLLGFSVNETDPSKLNQTADLLRAQKPMVQAYLMDEMFDKMENGEAAISPAYSGDIVSMMSENSDLGYCFPEEGTNLFVDGVCITKDAKNVENAQKFIDFLCRPDVALANAEFIQYSTPIAGAYAALDQTIRDNPIAYPSPDQLANCETYIELPIEITEQMENLWIDIRK